MSWDGAATVLWGRAATVLWDWAEALLWGGAVAVPDFLDCDRLTPKWDELGIEETLLELVPLRYVLACNSCELEMTSCELEVASWELDVISCELNITSWELDSTSSCDADEILCDLLALDKDTVGSISCDPSFEDIS